MSGDKVNIGFLSKLDLQKIQEMHNEGRLSSDDLDRIFIGSDLDYDPESNTLSVKTSGQSRTTTLQDESKYQEAILKADTNKDGYFSLTESQAALDNLVKQGELKANQVDPRQFLDAAQKLTDRRWRPIFQNVQKIDGTLKYSLYIDLLNTYNIALLQAGELYSESTMPFPNGIVKSGWNATLFLPAGAYNLTHWMVGSDKRAPMFMANAHIKSRANKRFYDYKGAIWNLQETFKKGIAKHYQVNDAIDALRGVMWGGMDLKKGWALEGNINEALKRLEKLDEKDGTHYAKTLRENLPSNYNEKIFTKDKKKGEAFEGFFREMRGKNQWAVEANIPEALKRMSSSDRTILEDRLPAQELYSIFSEPDPTMLIERLLKFALNERPGFLGYGGGNKDNWTIYNLSGNWPALYFTRTVLHSVLKKFRTGDPQADAIRQDQIRKIIVAMNGDGLAGFNNYFAVGFSNMICGFGTWCTPTPVRPMGDEDKMNIVGRGIDIGLFAYFGWKGMKGVYETNRVRRYAGWEGVKEVHRDYGAWGEFGKPWAEKKYIGWLFDNKVYRSDIVGKIPVLRGVQRFKNFRWRWPKAFRNLNPLPRSSMREARIGLNIDEARLLQDEALHMSEGIETSLNSASQSASKVNFAKNPADAVKHASDAAKYARKMARQAEKAAKKAEKMADMAEGTSRNAKGYFRKHQVTPEEAEAYSTRLASNAKNARAAANEARKFANRVSLEAERAEDLAREARDLKRRKPEEANQKSQDAAKHAQNATEEGKKFLERFKVLRDEHESVHSILKEAEDMRWERKPPRLFRKFREKIRGWEKQMEEAEILRGKNGAAARRGYGTGRTTVMDGLVDGAIVLKLVKEVDKSNWNSYDNAINTNKANQEADFRPKPSLFRSKEKK